MISIIVPVYKVEPYLHQCIDSILKQTYQDIEVLLIDDGSPDRCGEICEEYARTDNRIRVFHTENKGLSAARNLGLREAKGEYFGFVDPDDWIEPDMYEILLRRIEETNTNISACGIKCEYLNSKKDSSIDEGIYFGTEAIRAFICNLTSYAWNKLYKRTCWTDFSFPENHTYEDVATIYKVVLKADSLSCVPKTLYHYRKRDDSIIYTTKSMHSFIDYWFAYYGRYSFLKDFPETSADQKVVDKMENELAFVAVNIWRRTFYIPKEQRDYAFFQVISSFVQNNFPLFGKSGWNTLLRIGIFFSRYPKEISFVTIHILDSIYVFIKQMITTPYPSNSHSDMG